MQKKIYYSILSLLSRRDHSQHEIQQKLKDKSYPLELITAAIQQALAEGLLNDARFTENYIRYRREKGFGPQRISAELQARGIPAEMIAEHMQITDNAWFISAQKIWQKHFRGKTPVEFNERAKQMRFLHYRGFTREQIEPLFKKEDLSF
jgi:regulatory protein